ncbi:S8 family peptidase [Hymenobacter cavernae]|uniref:Fibronectin type III n=1 Tax=Hymenobacter cavernae TaxID=2044852 RepID=A0ABQ1TLF1_9BACT|nr:S8 family serine peptidase [Hymenobacter cavernae]GGE96344.1 fibronectin type III [Hymenobacter cavernae]
MPPSANTKLLSLLFWASTQLAAEAQPTAAASLNGFRPTISHQLPSAPASAEPSLRTDHNSRIAGDLQRLYASWSATSRARTATPQLRATYPQLLLNTDASSVLVRITGKDIKSLLPALQAHGFKEQSSWPALHFTEGFLPIAELGRGQNGVATLAEQGLLGVRASYRPFTNAGRVTSEADLVLQTERVRATQPGHYNGQGVRIGVMSDSFNALGGAAVDVASGDLPASVQLLQDLTSSTPGVTDEGRAMCQLIYDLAPGAQQVFSSVFLGEGNFAAQIHRLANPGLGNCKVLTDDIRYYEEPFFQDGVVAQAIDEVVTERGVAYFSSAGNYGSQSYENAAPSFVAIGNQGSVQLNFSTTGTDLTQEFSIPQGGNVLLALQWSDPFYTVAGVKTDLDAYLISSRGDTVALANDNNIGLQTPSEFLAFTNDTARTHTTTFSLTIVRFRGTANPTRLKYINAGTGTATEWLTNSGTVIGHAAAAQAQAVAAVGYYNQRTIQPYSSQGSPTILFAPNGTPLSAPEVRAKPNLTAVDGVNNTFFGSPGNDLEGDGFPNFFGTSAAAPHAAAAAALLRQAEPDLTGTQVYERFARTARDLGPPGFDASSGAGLLDAYAALYGTTVSTPVPTIQNFEGGALNQYWTTNNDLAGRVQIRMDEGPAMGRAHLVLSAATDRYFDQQFSSPSEAIFYTDASGVTGDVLLIFREKEFNNETDDVLPLEFTGSRNGDGVALSVDGGTTWYRLADLTGPNSTTAYRSFAINLSQFARARGLTLGSDVRLKFQQYGSGRPEATVAAQQGGIAFDDLALSVVLGLASNTDAAGLQAWPTPVSRGTSLNLALPAQDGSATLTLVDALGRTVWRREVPSSGKVLPHTASAPLTPGLYTLIYQPASGNGAARRILVE